MQHCPLIMQDKIARKKNKTPMGHIAHLRKQFKSLNKYDYIITLIQRIKKKTYENLLVLHLNKLESPTPKDALCQDWLKLAQWFWRRRFLNFVNVHFHYFIIISPLKRAGPFSGTNLNPLKSPSPKDALCQVWLKLAQWFWRRRWKCEKFTDRRTDR